MAHGCCVGWKCDARGPIAQFDDARPRRLIRPRRIHGDLLDFLDDVLVRTRALGRKGGGAALRPPTRIQDQVARQFDHGVRQLQQSNA